MFSDAPEQETCYPLMTVETINSKHYRNVVVLGVSREMFKCRTVKHNTAE